MTHFSQLVKLITLPAGQVSGQVSGLPLHNLWLHFHICKINYLADLFSNMAESLSCCIFLPDENSIETLQTTENAIATRLISVFPRFLRFEKFP